MSTEQTPNPKDNDLDMQGDSPLSKEVIADLKQGWLAAGRSVEEVEAMDRRTLLLAPMPCALGLIGHVKAIHGPQGQQLPTPISRYEAELIARHWVEQILSTRYFELGYAQTSSMDSRMRQYANMRIAALMDAGLLTDQRVDELYEAVRQTEGYPPFDQWASIRPVFESEDDQQPLGDDGL